MRTGGRSRSAGSRRSALVIACGGLVVACGGLVVACGGPTPAAWRGAPQAVVRAAADRTTAPGTARGDITLAQDTAGGRVPPPGPGPPPHAAGGPRPRSPRAARPARALGGFASPATPGTPRVRPAQGA